MHFASPLPWWLAVLAAAAVVGLAFFSYRRPIVPLSAARRGVLVGLRALSLAAVVLFLCRPVILVPPAGAPDVVVPILVDVSRSMRVADADGQTRIARAADLLQRELLPTLSPPFTPEMYGIGEALTPTSPDRLSADARQSDLSGALAAVRDRYRCRRVSGIVVLSDGGDTGRADGSTTGREPCRARVHRRDRIARRHPRSRDPRRHRRRSPARSGLGRPARVGRQPPVWSRAVPAAAARERPRARQPGGDARGRRVAGRRDFHGLARSGECDGLYRGDRAGAGRIDRREQRAQRARQPGGTEAPRAGARRRARPRAQLHDARADGRSGARIRFGRPKGQERERPGHVLRPGRRGPRGDADGRFPVDPRGAVRVRRADHRQRRSRLLHARPAGAGG